MLIVDAHAHIYSQDDRLYPPISKPFRPPAGTGTVAHLERERKAAGVRHVLAVQATTYYGWDNRFLVNAVRANADWMAGVCTLDPDDPHSPDLLEQYGHGHNIRGVRVYQAADGRLDHPGVVRLCEAARRSTLVVSVRINRDKSAELASLLRRFPELKVVLDHCLYIAAGADYEETLKDVLDLARCPNLHAKLSFLATGSARPYPFDDMHDACRRIIDAYGPDRCLWGMPSRASSGALGRLTLSSSRCSPGDWAWTLEPATRSWAKRRTGSISSGSPIHSPRRRESDETPPLPHDDRPGGRHRGGYSRRVASAGADIGPARDPDHRHQDIPRRTGPQLRVREGRDQPGDSRDRRSLLVRAGPGDRRGHRRLQGMAHRPGSATSSTSGR